MNSKFRFYYVPGQHLNFDEGMVPLKNRLATKQYIKDKPAKFGVKSSILCGGVVGGGGGGGGENGYILSAEIYTGRAEQEINEIGIISNVVYRLLTSAGPEGKNHILVMD